MRSHVAKTVSACYSVLRQLRNDRRSLSRSVLQSLVSSVVTRPVARLDYGNATLASGWHPVVPSSVGHELGRRLVFSSLRFDHITPLLRQLHWLQSPRADPVQARCSVVQVTSRDGTVLPRRRVPVLGRFRGPETAALHLLIIADCPSYTAVHRRRWAFPVAAARTWNSLPQHVTSAPSMPVFRGRLKAFLFRRSFP